MSESWPRTVLLTGAGLSKNFGAKLADEIWDRLISHLAVQADQGAKACLFEYRSFEEALDYAFTGEFGSTAYEALERAVCDEFIQMDNDVFERLRFDANSISLEKLRLFLGRFRIDVCESYCFTLNQDLLIERCFHCKRRNCCLPGVPGLSSRGSRPAPKLFCPNQPEYSSEWDVSIGEHLQRVSYNSRWNYIKLHGSFNWRDASGRVLMAMGKGKYERIISSWLLKEYLRKFEEVTHLGSVRLMVIGYSFKDEHINKIIISAIEKADLKLWIWDTRGSRSFLDEMEPYKPLIEKSVIGFTSAPMSEVFPYAIADTSEASIIVERFFHNSSSH